MAGALVSAVRLSDTRPWPSPFHRPPIPTLPLPLDPSAWPCQVRNKMHINDWAAIQGLWDKLGKQLERAQKAGVGGGGGMLGTPRVYVKLLCDLEDFLTKALAGDDVSCVWGGDQRPCCSGEGTGREPCREESSTALGLAARQGRTVGK